MDSAFIVIAFVIFLAVFGCWAAGGYDAEQTLAKNICGEASALVENNAVYCEGPNGFEKVIW